MDNKKLIVITGIMCIIGTSITLGFSIRPQPVFIAGDLDGDLFVTQADVNIAMDIATGRLIPTPLQMDAGDMNHDGRINSADVAIIMRLAQ